MVSHSNASLLGVKSRGERLDDDLINRQRFKYTNKKYIEKLGTNPVVVLPSQGVQSLDMNPRVNIIEDLQFRKALPKSVKLFDKMAPFSEKLSRIRDNKKFMSAISKDMMRTVIAREAQYYKSNNEGQIKEAPVNKEDKNSDDESLSSAD